MRIWWFKKAGPPDSHSIEMAETEQEAREEMQLDETWELRDSEEVPDPDNLCEVAQQIISFGKLRGIGSRKLWYFRRAGDKPAIWEVEARSEDEAGELLPEGLWILIGNALCNRPPGEFPIRKFTLEVNG